MKNLSLFILVLISNVAICQIKPSTEWVFVKGGSFNMGCKQSDSDCYPDEQPEHKVNINSFEIAKYEVSVKEYRMFCNATNRKMPKAPSWGWIDNHPIVNVTWQDAVDYAKWIGGRLPSEAEWEFAAKGGTLSNNYIYSGSNNPNEVGWSYENSPDGTKPIGGKKANELGIHDMSGNAWEWVNDNYEIFYYEKSPLDNPKGPSEGIGKCNRGGCWNFDYKLMRISHRRGSGNTVMGFGTGFRVARDIKQ